MYLTQAPHEKAVGRDGHFKIGPLSCFSSSILAQDDGFRTTVR